MVPHILLVEDDEDDIEFARRALAARKILNPVVAISDVKSAKAHLLRAANSGEMPVVAILDLHLPGDQTGLDLLAWIHADPQLRNLPAIMLTASIDRTDEARAFHSNALLVLHKPITPELLVDALNSLRIDLTESSIDNKAGVVLKGQPS